MQEGEERFTLELTAFDLSIVLVTSVVEVVIADDDGMNYIILSFSLLKITRLSSSL